MIRRLVESDIPLMLEIINDAAGAFKDVIPDDCWREPYMPEEELMAEIADGIDFWGLEDGGVLVAVMGIQNVQDVTLIRHAYVRSARRRRGYGGRLLAALRQKTERPILMGTWSAASWAIGFYEKHGFVSLPALESARLLRRYWKISDRQVETSVVLAELEWLDQGSRQHAADGLANSIESH